MIEIWKNVVGYEGKFEVSNLGRIRGLDRITIDKNGNKKRINGKLKNFGLCKGYYTVSLNHKSYRVNRIVAEAFIPNPYNLPHVNHINENKLDNRVENLEWCDAKYNNNYGTRLQRISDTVSKKIYQFDLDGNLIRSWDKTKVAAQECNVSHTAIRNNLCGLSYSAGKYIWSYNNDYEKIKLIVEKLNKPNPHCKKIIQSDLDDNIIKIWNSLIEVKEELKLNHITPISNCLNNRSKTSYGYKWSYF